MKQDCANCKHVEVSDRQEPCRSCVPGYRNFEPKQPARKPQCKTRPALFREFARVLEMCDGTGINPCACVKFGALLFNTFASFVGALAECEQPEGVEFALAIVEGKPVWRGDFTYTGDNRRVEMQGILPDGRLGVRFDSGDYGSFLADELMIAPIKPATISINGVEVKAPSEIVGTYEGPDGDVCVRLHFANELSAKTFKAALEGRKP